VCVCVYIYLHHTRSLDLNKRDVWKRVLSGSMHDIVWRGAEEEDEEEEDGEEAADDDDEDDGDEEEDDDDDDEEQDGEEEDKGEGRCGQVKQGKAGRKKNCSQQETRKSNKQSRSSASAGGLRAEMDALRAQLDTTNDQTTPLLVAALSGGGGGSEKGERATTATASAGPESLRDFYSRTAEYWISRAVEQMQAAETSATGAGTGDDTEPLLVAPEGFPKQNQQQQTRLLLSEKEVKRVAFSLAETRYQELLPMLSRLFELEVQQQQVEQEEEQQHGRSRGSLTGNRTGGSRASKKGGGGGGKK